MLLYLEVSCPLGMMVCTVLTPLGVVGARDGTLAIMVGGDTESFGKAIPVLSPMAKKVTHCGDLGTGLAAKISNKYVPSLVLLN